MRTKPFSKLRDKMTPEQKAKSETRSKLVSLHIALIELQESLGITQEDLEKDLGIDFSNFSDLDNSDDIKIIFLSNYIKALGGNLKLVAHFPDREIVLAKYE